MAVDWYKYGKKELLHLPRRAWTEPSWYNGLLLVNTRQKHDSGYNNFAVITLALYLFELQ